jgi:hypothetical protein
MCSARGGKILLMKLASLMSNSTFDYIIDPSLLKQSLAHIRCSNMSDSVDGSRTLTTHPKCEFHSLEFLVVMSPVI